MSFKEVVKVLERPSLSPSGWSQSIPLEHRGYQEPEGVLYSEFTPGAFFQFPAFSAGLLVGTSLKEQEIRSGYISSSNTSLLKTPSVIYNYDFDYLNNEYKRVPAHLWNYQGYIPFTESYDYYIDLHSVRYQQVFESGFIPKTPFTYRSYNNLLADIWYQPENWQKLLSVSFGQDNPIEAFFSGYFEYLHPTGLIWKYNDFGFSGFFTKRFERPLYAPFDYHRYKTSGDIPVNFNWKSKFAVQVPTTGLTNNSPISQLVFGPPLYGLYTGFIVHDYSGYMVPFNSKTNTDIGYVYGGYGSFVNEAELQQWKSENSNWNDGTAWPGINVEYNSSLNTRDSNFIYKYVFNNSLINFGKIITPTHQVDEWIETYLNDINHKFDNPRIDKFHPSWDYLLPRIKTTGYNEYLFDWIYDVEGNPIPQQHTKKTIIGMYDLPLLSIGIPQGFQYISGIPYPALSKEDACVLQNLELRPTGLLTKDFIQKDERIKKSLFNQSQYPLLEAVHQISDMWWMMTNMFGYITCKSPKCVLGLNSSYISDSDFREKINSGYVDYIGNYEVDSYSINDVGIYGLAFNIDKNKRENYYINENEDKIYKTPVQKLDYLPHKMVGVYSDLNYDYLDGRLLSASGGLFIPNIILDMPEYNFDLVQARLVFPLISPTGGLHVEAYFDIEEQGYTVNTTLYDYYGNSKSGPQITFRPYFYSTFFNFDREDNHFETAGGLYQESSIGVSAVMAQDSHNFGLANYVFESNPHLYQTFTWFPQHPKYANYPLFLSNQSHVKYTTNNIITYDIPFENLYINNGSGGQYFYRERFSYVSGGYVRDMLYGDTGKPFWIQRLSEHQNVPGFSGTVQVGYYALLIEQRWQMCFLDNVPVNLFDEGFVLKIDSPGNLTIGNNSYIKINGHKINIRHFDKASYMDGRQQTINNIQFNGTAPIATGVNYSYPSVKFDYIDNDSMNTAGTKGYFGLEYIPLKYRDSFESNLYPGYFYDNSAIRHNNNPDLHNVGNSVPRKVIYEYLHPNFYITNLDYPSVPDEYIEVDPYYFTPGYYPNGLTDSFHYQSLTIMKHGVYKQGLSYPYQGYYISPVGKQYQLMVLKYIDGELVESGKIGFLNNRHKIEEYGDGFGNTFTREWLEWYNLDPVAAQSLGIWWL